TRKETPDRANRAAENSSANGPFSTGGRRLSSGNSRSRWLRCLPLGRRLVCLTELGERSRIRQDEAWPGCTIRLGGSAERKYCQGQHADDECSCPLRCRTPPIFGTEHSSAPLIRNVQFGGRMA